MSTLEADAREAFLGAVDYQGPVEGFTHSLYKYPARFSPVFARRAVEAFTKPGETVLDPFSGGGTSIVEARLAGRNAFGSDLSSLAVFVANAKTVRLAEPELEELSTWLSSTLKDMRIHRRSRGLKDTEFEGYDRNMPWQLRKMCEQYLERVDELPTRRQRRFARCTLLRTGQWALDCKDRIPSTDEFRSTLTTTHEDAFAAMRDYRRALDQAVRRGTKTRSRCIQAPADKVCAADFGPTFSRADMVLTSPPYPGVHVLYHRWNVQTRRETPAPFWIAGCTDGHGGAHYTLGGRHKPRLPDYYSGITASFDNLRRLLKRDAIVVQLVAFSNPDWQLREYLCAMRAAGFHEELPSGVGLKTRGRLWRDVPGRRWYSQLRGSTPSSREVVLFHRRSRTA